jgi:hypothetical protein
MKNFELTSDMLTIGGVFYPRGYAFVMFPSGEDAMQVAKAIEQSYNTPADLMLLKPQTILREVAKLDDDSDLQLPSVGTEGHTVNRYAALARAGHHALMVKVDSDDDREALMKLARKANFSFGQRYHLLAIEDLE